MDKQPQSTKEMSQLAELVKTTRTAMLTTAEPDGTLRSRPLATLQFDSQGQLWFFTSISSPKVEEIEQHREVNLSYANPEKQDYVSISGTAQLVRDPAKMRELWTPWVKPWFPRGLEDSDLALLKVTMHEAEYWDAPASKMKRLYGLSKAIATGKTDALGENQKVTNTPPRSH